MYFFFVIFFRHTNNNAMKAIAYDMCLSVHRSCGRKPKRVTEQVFKYLNSNFFSIDVNFTFF